MAREAVGREVGAQLTPDTMVSLMFQSEQKWALIESFVTVVKKTRSSNTRTKSVKTSHDFNQRKITE